MTQQAVYSFVLNMKQLILMLILRTIEAFKSFKYKAKLLGNTIANGLNRILKDTTIAVPLKYLSNFWRSLEMTLIKFKVELKLK